MSQAGTSTTTIPPATSTATTTIPTGGGGGGGGGGRGIPAPPPGGGGGGGIPAPPPGGGGGGGRGGGEGGAARGPPPANGRLEGNPPFEFTGDRERSKAFMLAFQIYRGMNPNADVMTNPYQRTMTFLSYIRGPLVDDWVQEQAQWLVDQIQGGVLQTEENLWRTIDTRFRQAYTDTAESAKAQHKLKSLHMTKDNLDDFISRFQNLANKAGYDLDQRVTLDLFQNGLPNNLVWNCVKFDHPYDWATWTNSAHQQHEEYIQLSNWLKGNKVMGGTCEQWTNALTRRQDPNAMDVGQARARATMMEEEKTKRIKEGKCFQCDQKGHISRFCPQKKIAQASTTPSSSNDATIATATITSNKSLSADQKAEIFLAQLYNESDDVRARFANIMFNKKEDFPHA